MEYEEHWQAFDAGVWLEDDPGSWLGCAIIYKLDGLIHIDTQQQKSHCIIPLWKVYQGGNDGSTVECQVQVCWYISYGTIYPFEATCQL